MGFRATLNFQKIKVALNPMYSCFKRLCQKLRFIMLIKIDNTKKIHLTVFEL